MVLNKVTFYNKTISLTEAELADLKAGKYTSIFVSYIGKKRHGDKTPQIFKTNVTWIQDIIDTTKRHTKGDVIFYTAIFR